MGRTDEATLVIDASSVRVYKALVDPAAVARWLPPVGMSGRVDHFEAKPGGSYRIVLTTDDPTADLPEGSEDVVQGRFVEVRPGVRIVQEIVIDSEDPSGTVTMTREVSAQGARALVTFRAEGVPDAVEPDAHRAGMDSALRNLAALVGR